MKIKLQKKDWKILRDFIGRTSTCDIKEFCAKVYMTQDASVIGAKVDHSLYLLYKALGLAGIKDD
jgi:hypothetical protein